MWISCDCDLVYFIICRKEVIDTLLMSLLNNDTSADEAQKNGNTEDSGSDSFDEVHYYYYWFIVRIPIGLDLTYT